MRVHIEIDDDVVRRIDAAAGHRERSAFVRRAIEVALTDADRWARLARAAGSISDGHHDWDVDPAKWVRKQRSGDSRRGG